MPIRKLRTKDTPESASAPRPEKAKEATGGAAEEKPEPELQGHSMPSAEPKPPEQPITTAAAPDSAPAPSSFLPPNPNVVWNDPKADPAKNDSLGSEKSDKGEFGPRGASLPPDLQTDVQRQTAADEKEAKLRENMASTAHVDSIGRPKGAFKTAEQGFDSHGARIPDVVDYSQVLEEHPVHVGPRGQGAPKDTFHGKRPAAR